MDGLNSYGGITPWFPKESAMRKGASILVAVALIATVLVITSCGPAKPKEKVLGMSFPADDHGWVAAVI
jgi:hypothetical protein